MSATKEATIWLLVAVFILVLARHRTFPQQTGAHKVWSKIGNQIIVEIWTTNNTCVCAEWFTNKDLSVGYNLKTNKLW